MWVSYTMMTLSIFYMLLIKAQDRGINGTSPTMMVLNLLKLKHLKIKRTLLVCISYQRKILIFPKMNWIELGELLEMDKLSNFLLKYQEEVQDFLKKYIHLVLLDNLQVLMKIGKKESLKIQFIKHSVLILWMLRLQMTNWQDHQLLRLNWVVAMLEVQQDSN